MAEETLYDSEAMRRFAGIELGDDRIPNETTILNFRHLLERHGLTEALFAQVNAHLADNPEVPVTGWCEERQRTGRQKKLLLVRTQKSREKNLD
jgi:hypothetical protein